VGKIMHALGGGGHPAAGSALIIRRGNKHGNRNGFV
jgi:hypothetical protein